MSVYLFVHLDCLYAHVTVLFVCLFVCVHACMCACGVYVCMWCVCVCVHACVCVCVHMCVCVHVCVLSAGCLLSLHLFNCFVSRLQSNNITLKPSQWKLISIVLLYR